MTDIMEQALDGREVVITICSPSDAARRPTMESNGTDFEKLVLLITAASAVARDFCAGAGMTKETAEAFAVKAASIFTTLTKQKLRRFPKTSPKSKKRS